MISNEENIYKFNDEFIAQKFLFKKSDPSGDMYENHCLNVLVDDFKRFSFCRLEKALFPVIQGPEFKISYDLA